MAPFSLATIEVWVDGEEGVVSYDRVFDGREGVQGNRTERACVQRSEVWWCLRNGADQRDVCNPSEVLRVNPTIRSRNFNGAGKTCNLKLSGQELSIFLLLGLKWVKLTIKKLQFSLEGIDRLAEGNDGGVLLNRRRNDAGNVLTAIGTALFRKLLDWSRSIYASSQAVYNISSSTNHGTTSDLLVDPHQILMITVAATLRTIGYKIEVYSLENGPAFSSWRTIGVPVNILDAKNKTDITVEWLKDQQHKVDTTSSKETQQQRGTNDQKTNSNKEGLTSRKHPRATKGQNEQHPAINKGQHAKQQPKATEQQPKRTSDRTTLNLQSTVTSHNMTIYL
ncbi:hypothetical protein LXL04_038561 [Taraxacum kok-saghyz]